MADSSHDPNRVDQIVRVDTNSLLVVIRDLEAKLSEYHRQDKIPPWAEALVHRIDGLEQKVVLNEPHGSGGGGGGTGITMSDLSNDERLMVKIRAAMDNQMGSTRLGLESRLTAVSFEMERLHKLLNIRPTTSEFQHVVSSVSDVQRRMFDSVDELSKNVKAIVQEKVTKEMDDILQQMKSSEESQKKNNDLTMAKIDALSADILNLVGGDNSLMEKTVERVSGEINSLRVQLKDVQVKSESDIGSVQYALQEMRFGADKAREMLTEFKVRDSDIGEMLSEVV